jgi:CobQ-like glutamine amidotransferase family enzyme
LSLAPEHQRGHGALYDGINHGRVDLARLRNLVAAQRLRRTADDRIVLAVDVSPWLRPDANTSPERSFCHTYGRGKGQHLMIPGWPYSVVAALETGRTSWTALLAADVLAQQTGLLRAVDRGAPVLAVCAGLQLLGRQFTLDCGKPQPGAGLLDLVTTPATHRAIGEVITQPEPGLLSEPLTGFENHRGHTELGPAAQPLGRVIRGVGNGTGIDGVVQGRVIGTYPHGPVLARNPELADVLLSWVIGRPLPPVELVGLTELRRQRLARYRRRQSWNDFRQLAGRQARPLTATRGASGPRLIERRPRPTAPPHGGRGRRVMPRLPRPTRPASRTYSSPWNW